MRSFSAFLASILTYTLVSADFPLCGTPPTSYLSARNDFPNLIPALDIVGKQPVASWWTDNNPTYRTDIITLMSNCNDTSTPVIVVYGLPQKDCGASYSDKGFVKDTASYLIFIQDLVSLVGNRSVLYVMEPDAIGMAADGGCGKTNGYLDNMQKAVPLLTSNPNAKLYFDVGFWLLNGSTGAEKIAEAVKYVGSKSREGAVKGIVLNTSNYRRTNEMLEKCSLFLKTANTTFKCVIDTSRNYRTPNTTVEWCNNKYGSIGVPPTSQTGSNMLDYFLWVKVPGESDGECNSTAQSNHSMVGPRAGQFFEKAFSMQWDRGYFVDKKLGKKLGQYDLGDDMPKDEALGWGGIVAIGIACTLLIAGGVFIKRRHDAKKGKAIVVHTPVAA